MPATWIHRAGRHKDNATMHRLAIVSAALFILSACAAISPQPRPQPGIDEKLDARVITASLSQQNQTLESFKGLGKLKIDDGGHLQSYRIAWAGLGETKMRIEVLDPSGRPAASFANDGKRFYLLMHHTKKFYNRSSSYANLQKFLSVPVRFSDVQAILTGRIPLRGHNRAVLRRQGNETGYVLDLKKWWGATVQRVYLDTTLSEVRHIEMFTSGSELAYRVRVEDLRDVGGFLIPYHFAFADDQGRRVDVTIDKFWANVPVPGEMFHIARPG